MLISFPMLVKKHTSCLFGNNRGMFFFTVKVSGFRFHIDTGDDSSLVGYITPCQMVKRYDVSEEQSLSSSVSEPSKIRRLFGP
jgi:hypothetical protein